MNHRLHLVPCIAALLVVVALVATFGPSGRTLGYVAMAAVCPVSMLLMMRSMGHQRHIDHERQSTNPRMDV